MKTQKQVVSIVTIAVILTALLTWVVNNYFIYGVTDETTSKFRAATGIIQRNSFEQVTDTQLQEGALRGLVGSLEDEHSLYLTQEEVEAYERSALSEYTGIGIKTTKIIDGYMVVEVANASPAQVAGISENDIITTINGISVQEAGDQSITKLLENKIGETIKVKVLRDGKEQELELQEATIDFTSTTSRIYEQDGKQIAILDLQVFTAKTPEVLEVDIAKLNESAVDAIVMDLRNNSGGAVEIAQKILELTISNREPFLKVQNREQEIKEFRSSNNSFKIQKPMVILVNEKTASAAEVVAAAYSQIEGVKLVGNSSFGKGTIQEVIKLSDGSAIKLTTKHWLTPQGMFLEEGKGLVPDVIQIDSLPYTIYTVGASEEFVVGDRDLIGQSTIVQVQMVLTYFGYEVQRSDGLFDTKTEEELKAFQRDNGIPETGTINQETLFVMNKKLLDYTKDVQNDLTLQQALQQF